MSKDTIYVGTDGFPIGIDTKVNLTGATRYVFEVRKPHGDIVFWQPSRVERKGILSGLLYYTQPDDLDQAGDYSIHAVLDIGTLKNAPCEEVLIEVKARHGARK